MDSTTLMTPAGRLAIVANPDGSVAAAGFCDIADLEHRLTTETRQRSDLGEVSRAAAAYLDGDLDVINDLVCAQPGTPHRQRVWAGLRDIPAGTTVSYGELTRSLGMPVGASRAVGSACGANLIAPFVPCHRVVRTGGGLGGYYYGLPVKEWLLTHERTLAPPSTRSPAAGSVA